MMNLKSITILGLALTCIPPTTFADTETINGITWTYTDYSNGEVSIGGGGSSSATGVPTSTSGQLTIPSTLGGKPVTSIGASAFYGCSGLTSVTIPDSVTSIGQDAFRYCSGLTSVTIPDNVTSIGINAFFECSGLTSVTIPQYVCSRRASEIFPTCRKIRDIVISDSVTSIGSSAFSDCSGLTSVTIPDSVTSIGSSAFSGCSGLTSVTIPNSVTSIWSSAFSDCSGLTSVTVPQCVCSSRMDFMFRSVYQSITNLVIGGGVTNIGNSAFSDCSGLTSVMIPDSVTSIGRSAFFYCSGLTSVTIPNSVTSIGDSAFSGCSGLKSVTIPNSVTSIRDSAFSSCSGLTSVTIPDSVTSIGRSAFDYCSGLTSVTIPHSVTNIGSYAFFGCRSLTNVTIPASIVSINTNVFNACNSKLKVFMPTTYAGITPSNGTIIRYKPEQIVTFDVQSGIAVPDPIVAVYGAVYGSLPSLTRPGYSFQGWTLDGVNVGEDTIVYALDDHTLVTQWNPIQYTMTFDANGGVGRTSGNQDFDSAIVVPTVTRTGYTFVGWIPSVPATVPLGGATYTAQWEINQYAVTFDANGGVGGTSDRQDYGTAIVAPTVTRAGYTFKGWSPSVAATVPANNVTYTAQWEINKYTVTFKANGGVGGTSNSQDYGTAIVVPMVTRTGYTFKGWSPSVAATVPANDVTYNAQWEINRYVVTFDANGGVGGTSGSQDYGTAIVAPTVTRTGYTFKRWSPNLSATVPANDVTYTAQWEINKYTVRFDYADGSGKITKLDYGTAIVAPTITRTGYTFKGWSPSMDATVPANDVTYTAQWEINQYMVTFNANGGTGGASGRQDYGTAITPPTVARTGYTFAGWSPSVASTVPANDVTYTAQWTPNKYMVTFDANGGLGGTSTELDYESTLVAPTVTRMGYTFKGWSPSVAATVPLGGATYTAQWQINQYTVTFNANGGAGGTSTKQDYGTTIVVPTVTRTGYTFKGWSPSVMSTVPAYNVTYTAQWEINKYTVTFDANGGTCGTETAIVQHGAALGELPVPMRTKAVFLGWFTGAEMRVNELTTVTGPVTLYAHWLTEVESPVVTTDWGSLVFRTNSCVVSISCATEGTSIYYTDDGTTPKKNDNYLYTEPLTITDTTTIKAVAVIGDIQSEYVTVTITKKLLTLEEALDVEEEMTVVTSAEFPWMPVLDSTANVGDAIARSGEIGDRTNTWLSATVSGAGTMSFWCKVSCEHDDDNTFTWDRLMVYTNDVEVVEWRMDGETDWTRREVSFAGGENTVKWVYFKDRSISEGEDCAWVDGVTWTLADVAVDVGGGKSVLVPMDWIDAHSNIVTAVGGDKSAAMKSTAANGRKVWECYVLGLDPEKTDDFKITSFPLKSDGSPDLNAITFEPEQNLWNLSGATPKLKGKATLDAEWQDVPPGGNPSFRFFTVEVQMP